MEASIPTLLSFFVGIIGAVILLYHQVNFWSRKGIPHLKPLPIIGNYLPLFFGRTSITGFISNIYNNFPEARYFGILGFQTPIAVLRDPELIKETCVKNFEYFLDHQSFIDEEMDPLFGKNVFSLKGDRWKVMRHTLSPSFTAIKMKFMFELIAKCSRDFVQYFIDHSDEAKSIETKDAFTRYTNDVIATSAFGLNVNSLQDKNNEFYIRGKDATSFKGILRIMKFFGFVSCPKIMRFLGITFFSRKTYQFFTAAIRDAIETREKKKIVRPDMLQLLIEARNEDNTELSIEDITAQAFIFFFAGFDPSSSLMCFVAHELAMNPEIQEKLREEVDTFINNEESDVSYETLSQMKYMDMVISETLRKYPPTPAIDRECVKKFTLPKPTEESREYTAEPKTLIWIPTYALHHDPQYFSDPEKFDPERFSEENKRKINPYTYLPFGVGPRKCLGNRFVLMETKILFVHILQNFILEKCEKTKHPIEFEKSITVTVKGGTWVKLSRRKY